MTLWRFGLQSVYFHVGANQPFSESVRVINFKTTTVTNYTVCMPLTFLFDVFFVSSEVNNNFTLGTVS